MTHEPDHMLCSPHALLPGPHDPQNTSVPTVTQLPEGKVLPTWQWREDKYADNPSTWPRITVPRVGQTRSGCREDKLHVLEKLWRKRGFLV